MTKQQEIDALDAFIARMGESSYLGPWLARNRDAVVSDIRNDVFLTPDWEQQKAAYQRTIAEAKAEAEAIKKAARDHVGKQIARSINEMSATFAEIMGTLNRARSAAEDIQFGFTGRAQKALAPFEP